MACPWPSRNGEQREGCPILKGYPSGNLRRVPLGENPIIDGGTPKSIGVVCTVRAIGSLPPILHQLPGDVHGLSPLSTAFRCFVLIGNARKYQALRRSQARRSQSYQGSALPLSYGSVPPRCERKPLHEGPSAGKVGGPGLGAATRPGRRALGRRWPVGRASNAALAGHVVATGGALDSVVPAPWWLSGFR